MIQYLCSQCGDAYEVESELAGKAIRCRGCSELGRVEVPAPPKLPRIRATVPAPTSVTASSGVTSRTEPMCYRFLEGYARLSVVLGPVLCVLTLFISLSSIHSQYPPIDVSQQAVLTQEQKETALASKRQEAVKTSALFLAVTTWLAAAVGFIVLAGLIELGVDIGRSLRIQRMRGASAPPGHSGTSPASVSPDPCSARLPLP